jgi:hypothetical protein
MAVSSTNGARKTGYSHGEDRKYILISNLLKYQLKLDERFQLRN